MPNLPLDPIHIAAAIAITGIVLVFSAVILAHFTTGKPSDNGLNYETYNPKGVRYTQNGKH